MVMIAEAGRERRREEALAICASVLFRDAASKEGRVEALLRRRNLVYSIDKHLDLHGSALDPLTRALLAASRETLSDAASNPST